MSHTKKPDEAATAGYVVAIEPSRQAAELREILNLPRGRRDAALTERAQRRREQVAAYAARQIDALLDE